LDVVEPLFLFLVAHAIADFGLQSSNMAKFKNKHNVPTNIPKGQKLVSVWQYYLSAHALIHGGIIYFVSGNFILGLIETLSHWIIDYIKCENITNPHIDQILHIICKVLYLFI
jgi:hypothetical protein